MKVVMASALAATTVAVATQLASGTPSSRAIHVCSSSVAALNGVYEVDESLRSDNAPVFTRTDEDGDDIATSDYRLFRHQGFWAFANFASWPPEVEFRCDPYRNNHEDSVACEKDQVEPPLRGYTSRQSVLSRPPTLQLHPCSVDLGVTEV
ncbi:hypothetical protein H310_08310 [Aphanomyces invadans]|uniref:Uncharacterized protein n=1 Tax=Aphanomyces invadans TaxID=157072 RepID=A0A024TZL4_9STRA|nr:hypothetical protein H310_08310 [Aphanomyces invadans]ETV98802.1 hypothetical protein H310_08310 [Aphanomyces invadans]|eukprot:XP_008872230.1 hypothetical protein H310_08310 [Aphanomyces invadans]